MNFDGKVDVITGGTVACAGRWSFCATSVCPCRSDSRERSGDGFSLIRSPQSNVAAIVAGRNANETAEDLTEVTLIDKAGASTGFKDGKLRFAQKFLGPLDALSQHKLMRALANALFEGFGKVVQIQASHFSKRMQMEIVAEVGVNVLDDAL